jgi:hypothetical protein
MIPEKLFQQLLVPGDAWRVKAVDLGGADISAAYVKGVKFPAGN